MSALKDLTKDDRYTSHMLFLSVVVAKLLNNTMEENSMVMWSTELLWFQIRGHPVMLSIAYWPNSRSKASTSAVVAFYIHMIATASQVNVSAKDQEQVNVLNTITGRFQDCRI